MICPRCGAEYRDKFVECADCHVPLVSRFSTEPPKLPRWLSAPPPEPAQPLDLVTVFRTGDPTKLMVAESILRSAQMEFISTGNNAPNVFGIGGISLMTGPVLIQVRREDARDAAAMLEHLARDEFDDEVGLEWVDDDADEGEGDEGEGDEDAAPGADEGDDDW